MSNANSFSSVSPVIFGCGGTHLNAEERAFFRDVNPYGFILFARNCQSPEQIRALVQEMRQVTGREDTPVLIDQEGGRVARLRPPHWREHPPAGVLAALARQDMQRAEDAVYCNARLIAHDLHTLGINVDCAPLLDVPALNAHHIIGDRAFGDEVDTIVRLGRAMAQGLMDGGIYPVIKHIPGHGRALVDSHEELPTVTASREELERVDFEPFRQLAHMPYAMTAHVLYTALDDKALATVSPYVVEEVIRRQIGFEGLLMSDDLSMKALGGDFADRTRRTLQAGCDLVLHCNGDWQEMQAIASALSPMSAACQRRVEQVRALALQAKPLNVAEAEARLQQDVAASLAA